VIGGEPCACARAWLLGFGKKNLAAVAKRPPSRLYRTWPAANGNEVSSTLPQCRSGSASGWLSCPAPMVFFSWSGSVSIWVCMCCVCLQVPQPVGFLVVPGFNLDLLSHSDPVSIQFVCFSE